MIEAFQTRLEDYWQAFILRTPDLLFVLIIMALSIFLGRLLSNFIRNRIISRSENPLLDKFISQIIRGVAIIIGLSLSMNILGLGGIAGSLMAGAGVTAIILGFAFKDIGENFLAGIILAFSRPFSIGDTIEVEKSQGKIVSLSIRHTQIKTFDGKDIYIPNAMIIKNPLINYTRDGFLRHDFIVGIDFEDDIMAARDLIIREMLNVEGVLKDKKPFVTISEFSTSSVNIKVYFWINTFKTTLPFFEIKTIAMNTVKVALQKNGFTLPSDIVEMKIYQEKHPIPLRIVSNENSPGTNA